MTRATGSMLLSLFLAAGLQAQPRARAVNDQAAVKAIDRAVTRMGGEDVLRAVTSLRLDMMTQWQRTGFSDHPSADRPSYERHVELRDYATDSWRNTRTFIGSAGGTVDIVKGTVGAREQSGPDGRTMASALNVAYVDERRELFGFAPERMLLLARDAGGMRALGDTVIAGVRHLRLGGSVDGFPATFFMNRLDGLPAMVRFRADEDNDFGLAPWGMMEVEFWYSGWFSFQPGVLLPRQRDVRRVGRPYKRETIISATVNPPVPADSFAISDSLAAVFAATQRKPMWDTWADSAPVIDGDFITLPLFSGSSGAVRIGGKWVLIEAGQSRGAAERLSAWLTARAPGGGGAAAAIVTHGAAANGGARWFAEQRIPLYVAASALPNMRHIVGEGVPASRVTAVTSSRWIKVGTDSLWLELMDVPDFPGILAVYSPTHRWLMSALVIGRGPTTLPEQEALIARLGARGLAVDWLGSARAFRTAVAP